MANGILTLNPNFPERNPEGEKLPLIEAPVGAGIGLALANFLKEEDYVIVVNTHSKYVLLTKLAGKDISIEFDNAKNTSSFNDKNQNFIVSGKYDDYVRLKILAKYELLDNWQWKS